MKKKRTIIYVFAVCLITCLLAGCTEAASTVADPPQSTVSGSETEDEPAGSEPEPSKKSTTKSKSISRAEDNTDEKSLAERMAGKYSFHYSEGNDDEELYTMEVLNFGDNLYALCARAMPDDDTFTQYSFWATEFISYDAKEMSSTEGNTVRVNELNFSVMSNVGKYWDSGHTGTVTLTDEGLVFEGFDNDGFLVPYDDDRRLFARDDQVEDAFSYLSREHDKGDKDLQGLWAVSDGAADLYIEFSGSDIYMYRKYPDREVFFAAGKCDFHDRYFDCTASQIQNGGMPFEFTANYEVGADKLSLVITSDDIPDELSNPGGFYRITKEDVHVTTMDEIVFNEDSFGAFGQMEKEPFYGLWIDAFKDEEDAKALVAKLQDKDLPAFYVYSCDWENLNKDPYYCVTIGRSDTEDGAKAYMNDAKEAGYGSAYVKYTGDHN